MYRLLPNQDFIDGEVASYSVCGFFGSGHLVIPFINLVLLDNNPLTKKNSVVDFSYYLFVDINQVDIAGAGNNLDVTNTDMQNDVHMTIGVASHPYGIDTRIHIGAKEAFYFIPETARVSAFPNFFSTVDTASYPANLKAADVERFFSADGLPIQLRSILGERIYQINWSLPY